MNGGENKHLLRQAMVGIVPDVVRMRKEKMGFPVPDVDWLYGHLRGEIHELIRSAEICKQGIFDSERLKAKYASELSEWDAGRSKPLYQKRGFWFRVASLELWHRRCLEYEFRTNDHSDVARNCVNRLERVVQR